MPCPLLPAFVERERKMMEGCGKERAFADGLEGLLDLIRTLRSPRGCPWDRVQTDRDLGRYLLSEAYEVLDAVDETSPDHIREELGDLLFQILFLVVLAEERGEFAMADVVRGVAEKMVRRHPHVFGDGKASNAAEVKLRWDEIKATIENRRKESSDLFDGIPRSLPALSQAQEVTRRAATVGFDWSHTREVLEKMDEEREELRQALAEGNRESVREEVGDLLLTLVNVSRFVQVDAELALRGAVAKFIRRFSRMEEGLRRSGRTLEEASMAEMDALWEEVKKGDP